MDIPVQPSTYSSECSIGSLPIRNVVGVLGLAAATDVDRLSVWGLFETGRSGVGATSQLQHCTKYIKSHECKFWKRFRKEKKCMVVITSMLLDQIFMIKSKALGYKLFLLRPYQND